MGYGRLLRKYREQAGLKLAELSELAQVDIGTISALETRDSSRSQYFGQLARALGLSMEQFANPDFDGKLVAIRDAETGRVLRVQLEGHELREPEAEYGATPPAPPGRHFDALTEDEQRFLDNFREIAADEDAARELMQLVENQAARMRAMKERWMAQVGIPVPPAKRAADAKKTAVAKSALDVTDRLRQQSLLDPDTPPRGGKKH